MPGIMLNCDESDLEHLLRLIVDNPATLDSLVRFFFFKIF